MSSTLAQTSHSDFVKVITNSTLSSKFKNALAQTGVRLLNSENGSMNLEQGIVMFAPTENDMRVRTAHGVVDIAAGSLVSIESSSNSTIIRNLHDGKDGAVRCLEGSDSVKLGVGFELVLTIDLATIKADVQGGSRIASRNSTSTKLSNGLTAQLSEFSLVSALANDQTLHALLHSSSKEDRKRFNQIAKNACILSTISTKRGPYSSSN
jgi:hypothetical protein